MNSTRTLPTIVYTPESQLRKPGRLLKSMGRDLLASRELAWRLAVRDISAKYRQSTLGILWAFLPPILTGLIFILLQSQNVVNSGQLDIPYPVFVLIGTTLWELFASSLKAPLDAVNKSKSLLAKINFPREALIISAVYSMGFSFLLKSIVIVGILLFFQIQISWGILLAPLVVLMLILLGITLGLFLVPLGSLYTDITSALPFAIQLGFFITPVAYTLPGPPNSLWMLLNPVAIFLVSARNLITGGAILNPTIFIIYSIFIFIALLFGWIIYRLALPIVIERMSA